jgi:hypothetical protein
MRPEQMERFMAAAQKDSSARSAVSIRLISADKRHIEQQIERLQEAFGAEIAMSQPRQSGHGLEWIAYGTFI